MKLTISAINQPWEDTALFIENDMGSAAWLFDCGNLYKMRVRDVVRVERIFMSHTHIDHFNGFDHFLHLNLRENKHIHIYGPLGFTAQINNRLHSYAWDYEQQFDLRFTVHELWEGKETVTDLIYPQGFEPRPVGENDVHGELELPLGVRLRFAPAVHRQHAPCLAYKFTEPEALRFDIARMKNDGLTPGPWIAQLKEAANRGNLEGEVTINGRQVSLTELADRYLSQEPGQSYALITDSIFNKESVKSFRSLGEGVDELWCEACYRHHQLDKAREYHHFTAKQAARLALELRAKKLFLFHYSRRYTDNAQGHIDEARTVFPNTQPLRQYDSQKP